MTRLPTALSNRRLVDLIVALDDGYPSLVIGGNARSAFDAAIAHDVPDAVMRNALAEQTLHALGEYRHRRFSLPNLRKSLHKLVDDLHRGVAPEHALAALDKASSRALGSAYLHRARDFKDYEKRLRQWEIGTPLTTPRRVLALAEFVRCCIPARGPGRDVSMEILLRLLAGRYSQATGRRAAQTRNHEYGRPSEGGFVRFLRAAIDLLPKEDQHPVILADRAVREAVDQVRAIEATPG